MTEQEYREIKERILKKRRGGSYPSNRESDYNDALLSAVSIVKSVYEKSKINNRECLH